MKLDRAVLRCTATSAELRGTEPGVRVDDWHLSIQSRTSLGETHRRQADGRSLRLTFASASAPTSWSNRDWPSGAGSVSSCLATRWGRYSSAVEAGDRAAAGAADRGDGARRRGVMGNSQPDNAARPFDSPNRGNYSVRVTKSLRSPSSRACVGRETFPASEQTKPNSR
jgi:hypothetical protein